MIKLDGQSYEILKGNQFRNTQTHEVIDGDNIRSKYIHLGSNNNLSGVNIGNTVTNVFSFSWKSSKSQKVYLKNVFPKIKREIENSIPLKDEKLKRQVLKCVTSHASCNYESKMGHAFYRTWQAISRVMGKSDWQAAKKAMQSEMDKQAAHHFLKGCVSKYKSAKASCK
jgi:hypothetical protein